VGGLRCRAGPPQPRWVRALQRLLAASNLGSLSLAICRGGSPDQERQVRQPCWAPRVRMPRKRGRGQCRAAALPLLLQGGGLSVRQNGPGAPSPHGRAAASSVGFSCGFVLPDALHVLVVFSVHPGALAGVPSVGAIALFLCPSSPAHDPAAGWLKTEPGQRRHMVWSDASIQALRVWDFTFGDV